MSIVSELNQVIPLLVGGGGALGVATKSIAFIREGQKGVRLRFGRAVRDKNGKVREFGPGPHALIPFVHSLPRRHVRQEMARCESEEVMLADNTVFIVSAVALFRVTSVYKALFEIDDLETSIEDICQAAIRSVLSQKNASDVGNLQEISGSLLALVREQTGSWGVEFISFNLTTCAPTAHTAELMLIEMQATRRADALTKISETLEVDVRHLDPGIAAAIIGTPVVSTISNRHVSRKPEDEEYDEE